MTQYTYNRSIEEDEEDDEEDRSLLSSLIGKQKPYQHYEHTISTTHTHFYLSKAIRGPSEYIDMIHRISNAQSTDVIFIHLNTPGGDLSTGVQIINAMQNSQAKIVTMLEGMVYSLGTLIFLSGDEMVVNDHCMMMCHNFRGGLAGPGHEIASQLEATVKWFSLLAKQIYIPFISEEELARIMKGEDLWMNSVDIRKRLDRMIKILKDQANPKVKKPRAPKTPVDNS